MESRAVIEQAKGIIMAANRCSPEAAFDILRRASQHQNRKLRDIAEEIVERTQRDLPSALDDGTTSLAPSAGRPGRGVPRSR
jgi:hypothetical protein